MTRETIVLGVLFALAVIYVTAVTTIVWSLP
jgi:hypothetical protein